VKIKGKVSRIFHRKDNGFKILVLELTGNYPLPEKYRNPDFPFSVSVAGNLKRAEEEYVIEISGEWEYRENGKYWPWQFKAESYKVCQFETPAILVDIISNLNQFGRARQKNG